MPASAFGVGKRRTTSVACFGRGLSVLIKVSVELGLIDKEGMFVITRIFGKRACLSILAVGLFFFKPMLQDLS